MDFFVRNIFKKYVKFALRENKKSLGTLNKIKLPLFDKSLKVFAPNNVIIQRNAFLFNFWRHP